MKRLLVGSIMLIGSICLGRQYMMKRAITYGGEDMISSLPDDLLVRILLLVPTKDAVATMILSKRWLSVWTMMPRLEYKDIKVGTQNRFLDRFIDYLLYLLGESESIWRFLNESLQLHKAPILERLIIELGPHCPVDVDVVKWISNAVDRGVSELEFDLMWSAKPTSLPKSLYICDTLVYLRLSNKVFVDVASPVCLPSLKRMKLYDVVYKDDDSLVRLLSGCPILKQLYVDRHDQDNLIKFSVKVPSLETLVYTNVKSKAGSLVINSAILKELIIADLTTTSCSIESKPCLDKAIVVCLSFNPDDKFMRSLSSVMNLELCLIVETVACCQTINFSRLIECKIMVIKLDWFEPFFCLLQNSPTLKVVLIDQMLLAEAFPLSFKQPNDVPLCLSTKLEIFEWKEYRGTSEEKEMLRYILANSKCLKRAGIALKSTWKWNKKKIMKELKSMYRISTSSQLLFSTQLEWTPFRGY